MEERIFIPASFDGAIHVMPRFEGEREHDESLECWCEPQRDPVEPRVIVHQRVASA